MNFAPGNKGFPGNFITLAAGRRVTACGLKTMKKKISAIVLLFAGALLMVLSVSPHHHHGERICFVSVAECTDCQAHRCGAAHEHGNPDSDCDLKQLFLMSGRYDQAAQQDDLHPDGGWQNLLFFTLCFSCPAETVCIATAPESRRVKYPPFVEPAGSRGIVRISGLRAPPIAIA